MANWSLFKFGKKEDNWPKTDTGERVEPVFLEHLTGSEGEVQMEVNMLSAFGIPVLYKYPNDGEFGKLILGFAGTGVDVYVPATMLEDARNILSADIQEEEDDQ